MAGRTIIEALNNVKNDKKGMVELKRGKIAVESLRQRL